MPLVVFESGEGPAVRVAGTGGERLVDLCDDLHVPIPFSCRSASCGTCRIDVIEGADLLDPPSVDELEVLHLFGDDPAQRRLACQARVRAGVGTLRVRPSADETGG